MLATQTSPAILDTATERKKSVQLATETQDCRDFQNVIFDFLLMKWTFLSLHIYFLHGKQLVIVKFIGAPVLDSIALLFS